MKELVLTALLAAGVSSAGTYGVMRVQPVPTVVDTSAMTDQLRQMNATLTRTLERQEGWAQIHASYQQLMDRRAQAQAEYDNRALIVSRIIAKSITGTDPLPILQTAKAADVLPPDPRMPR